MTAFIISVLAFFSLFINSDKVDSLTADYLKVHLKEYTKFEYEIISAPEIIKSLDLDVKIDAEREFKLSKNHIYMPIKMVDKKGKSTSSVVTIRVKLYKKCLVAQNDIKQGEELNLSKFRIEEKEVSLLQDKVIDPEARIGIVKLKTAMKAGTILQSRMLDDLPVVKRGSKVEAYVQNGSVVISLQAEARENGKLGEIISVITPDRKVFKAQVQSSELVKITE